MSSASPRWKFLGIPLTLLWGGAMMGVLVLGAVFAPFLSPYDPEALDVTQVLLPPSTEHWFGTDQYGQDIFTRVLYAARIDLLIGVVVVGVSLVLGTVIGITSAWFGGIYDAVVQRIIDIGFAFPFLVLVIAMVGLRGPGLSSLFIAVGLIGWIVYARLVRTEVLVVQQSEYVAAAKMSGFSNRRILGRHILPNVSNQLLVYASSDFVYAVLLGASISYLGLGVQPPTPEWGAMVRAGQNFVADQWWISFFPGMAIVFLGIACALIGDGLNQRLSSPVGRWRR
jgi:peptide/nickel transport system permease protein